MLTIRSNTPIEKILDYAEQELGVKLDPELSRDELKEKVRELEKAAGITVDEDKSQGKEVKEKITTDSKPKANPTSVIIRIHQPPANNEDDNPDTHCVVVFNGRNFQIQYDEEVTVPYGIYDIINNAKQVKYFKKKNPETGKDELQSKIVFRFPFSLIKFID